MEMLLGYILSYLISLAASLRNDSIAEKRRKKLKERIEKDASLLQSIRDKKSFKERARLVGADVARLSADFGVTRQEKPLFHLMTDEIFQEDLAVWLTAWNPGAKKRAEEKLSEHMVSALRRGEASDE